MKKLMKKPVLLLAAAAVLLLASSVGSTQAALTYYSENYMAEVKVANIGVTVLENGNVVNFRNYLEDGKWDTKTENNTLALIKDGEQLIPGKTYEDKIVVRNSGAIDTYVRVIVTKSWKDADGKDTTLSPAYIELNVPDGNGWEKDPAASTTEREVYYYTQILPADTDEEDKNNDSAPLTDTFRINPAVAKELIQTTNGKVITYTYKYDGYESIVEIEADAVQTHNAANAIKSAWGVDVTVAADGSLSLN